uniref:Actin-binding Rho-activating protein n=1 Tax=Cacopsylla melanoneura TaxID=428564 RepID=A0A8D8W783_9HEMI
MSESISVFDKLSDKVSKFNQQINKHQETQSVNPFSGSFGDRSPSPRYGKFTKEEYGKPIAGSETERRGLRAKAHLLREMLDLCVIIHDLGEYHAKHRAKDDPEDDKDRELDDDGTIMVTFGELFQLYTKISDKVVGLLMAAKKKGWVYFEPEILFQRRDDDVLIVLLKPISEIKKYVDEETKPAQKEILMAS